MSEATVLLGGISRAIQARDFGAVAAFMRRLAVIDPVMAQGVLDAVDLAVVLKEQKEATP